MSILITKRLRLRPWRLEDLKLFQKMNADPRVMECFPAIRTKKESLKEYERIQKHFREYGWGPWAVSEIDKDNFIGFIGIKHVLFTAPFTPAVEIGWRLAFDYWGKGYATEGALKALRYGFETLQLKEIMSFATVKNARSIHVMEKIGMQHNPTDDFDHPLMPEGDPIRKHVLYRLTDKDWSASRQSLE